MKKRVIEEIIERLALALVLWDQESSRTFISLLQALEKHLSRVPETVRLTLGRLKDLVRETPESLDAGKIAQLEEGFALIRDYLNGKKRLQEMEAFVKAAGEGGAPVDFTLNAAEIEQLSGYYADLAAAAVDCLKSIEQDLQELGKDGDYLIIPRIGGYFHRLAALAGLSGCQMLADTANAVENALERLQNDETILGQGLIDCLNSAARLIFEVIQKLPDDEEKSSFDYYWKKRARELIERFNRGLFELPVDRRKIGEILVDKGIVTSEQLQQALAQQEIQPEKRLGEILVQKKQATREQIDASLQEQKQQTTTSRRETEITSTIRIDTEKLDLLLDTIGEIVVAHSLVASDCDIAGLRSEKTQAKIGLLTRNILTLQRIATNLRMVPIRQVFQKLGRISREIAQKSGKEIRVIFEGEKTEIDRNVAEMIYDPLVHMVRNAADHGVEAPEIRQACGKPSFGTIKISAECRQGKVVIRVSDDGKGLDKEKILAKALEQGLVKPDQDLTETQIYQLIFLPGLSTAAEVTEISGRGVGMDVVKTNIEKLQGKIKVDTVPGQGTTFTIRLPLTLAILDGMTVRVGEQRYVLPLTAVREIFRPASEQIFTIRGRDETVKLRENVYPLIRLARKFQIPGAVEAPTKGVLIIVEDESGKAALMVDELLGKQQVVAKNMGDGFKNLKGVSGAAILGQGNLGLILDVTAILHEELVN